MHEQGEFFFALGELYLARRVGAHAGNLLSYREQWLSTCIVRSTGNMIHDAMLAICGLLRTVADWVRADTIFLNMSAGSIRWGSNVVLCSRDVSYGPLHLIFAGGPGTYLDKSGLEHEVMRT